MSQDFHCQFLNPEPLLADFVSNIGMFCNPSDQPKELVVLPDGRIDLFFLKTGSDPFQTLLIGLETEPEPRSVPPGTLAFVVSFKPLGLEYLLKTPIADIANSARLLPDDFWDLKPNDLEDLDAFYKKATQILKTVLPADLDQRKRKLFRMVFDSNGGSSIKTLSEAAGWSSRQINRYFTRWFGISLKAYCTILRFRASLEHIAEGKLFPEDNFADQTHFIREIRKFSGVVPKTLSQNQDDRFVLLSVLKQQ